MKTPITMIAALLSFMASGQEAEHLPFWLGPKAVFAQHEGLDEFNAAIQANGADEINTTAFAGGALLFTRAGKFDFGLDAAAVSLSNGVKPPGMQIIFSYISGDFNAGYNLFDAEANTRLAPYAGIGNKLYAGLFHRS